MSCARLVLALRAGAGRGAAAAQSRGAEYPSIERGWSATMHWDQAHEKPGEFVVQAVCPAVALAPICSAAAGRLAARRHGVDGRLPEADRTFARILSRLTKIDVPSSSSP